MTQLLDLNNNIAGYLKKSDSTENLDKSRSLMNAKFKLAAAKNLINADEKPYRCRFLDLNTGERCEYRFNSAYNRARREKASHKNGFKMAN